jgi:hypothetical protein
VRDRCGTLTESRDSSSGLGIRSRTRSP